MENYTRKNHTVQTVIFSGRPIQASRTGRSILNNGEVAFIYEMDENTIEVMLKTISTSFMLVNYEITDALKDEAEHKCYPYNPNHVYISDGGFFTKMGKKYMIPARAIFEADFLDDNFEPQGIYKENGWIAIHWSVINLTGTYYMNVFIAPEAQDIMEFIFKTLSESVPNSMDSQPIYEIPKRRVTQTETIQ